MARLVGNFSRENYPERALFEYNHSLTSFLENATFFSFLVGKTVEMVSLARIFTLMVSPFCSGY
jgi:hypothetical protein